jgi:hypothetical protein
VTVCFNVCAYIKIYTVWYVEIGPKQAIYACGSFYCSCDCLDMKELFIS